MKDELLSRIRDEEVRLASLERETSETRARLEALRGELATASTIAERARIAGVTEPSAPHSPAEKVELFHRLFRGRADVFPRLWVNERKGTKGYAPACFNEWVRGVCEKPRVRCGECPNQAFVPVDDQVVLDHLRGLHVIGVYPLLEDETCWFLAADFDGDSWRDDVAAFAETCRSSGVPIAVERSRSGNGAHAWFFFAEPVSASVARRMGCYLVTETMTRRHELGMSSYDRLFPNQDTMPRGGFGNLIALPLQLVARRQGNTVFLDERFEPFADQWAFLAALQPMRRERVDEVAREAARLGHVVGVRSVEVEDEAHAKPWMRPPSGWSLTLPIEGRLPEVAHAVLAQRLFVEKAGLPSQLINGIKRLAAFQNPEFYKKQSMRLSTALTPRVIACAEDLPDHVALPRGCRPELERLLDEHGVKLAIEDARTLGDPVGVEFCGELTPLQESAARPLVAHDDGVFVGPPGVGKTVLGAYLIAQRGRSALVLVHRRPLLDQWVAQLSMFLGMEEREIGRIGGGKQKPNGRLDVAMIQSLVRDSKADDRVATYGHVIVDECHHVPAVSFERVLSEVKARYVLGLTATPQRRDGHQPILEMQLGPVRFSVDAKSQSAARPFAHTLVVRETSFRLREGHEQLGIQEIYRALASDEDRNRLILDDVIHAVAEGRSPILLTERRDHLEYFAEKLRGFSRNLVVLRGGMTAKKRRDSGIQLAELPDDAERLVLATGRYLGEGFDDARLDTLFLAMPISWKGTLVQYAGRLHRLHPRKTEVRIFDYVDRDVPMLARMFEKRLRTFRAIGYARGEAPLGYGEPADERVVEYDAEELRHFEGST